MIMKRILFFLISSLFWIAGELQAQTDSYVEVLYFHGKQRCITCKSIEKYTREVVLPTLQTWPNKGKSVSRK